MADEQKPTQVPETVPATTEAVTETKPEETTPATEAVAAAETTTATETPAEATETAAATETPAAAEEPKKEEVEPIEAGTLEHKGAPASFPKNIIFSKNHFWFGSEAMSSDKLATYLKNEKATDISHHVVSWSAETGKGLLFISKESDKAIPTGVIPLADASEPTTDGANKFTFTSKGHKHTFKAPTTAVRDNWVSQLRLKIAEAKELAATVTESENYKHTMESLNPAAESPKEEVAPEASKEDAADEEEKKDEFKEEKKEDKKERRSASRKRASIFGNLLGKKEEAKKETPAEEKPAEDKPAETTGTATAEAPAESAPATEPVVESPATETPAAPAETAESPKKEAAARPAGFKRSSIFGSLSFGKKKTPTESEAAPVTPVKETTAEAEPVAESAPVIPAMETTEPLSTEVTSPATAPTETTEAAPATNGETKKEMKSDKRKSSLPFSFGKKDKAATSDEEGEKVKSPPFFSKLRQTVKGKGKAEEKPAEKPAEDKPAETAEPASESQPEEAAAAEAKPEEAAPVAEENAEKPVATAPAPVTAAA
ncbi:hypothetical protein DL763_010395 [Monosporascus cannonballus]|nr:hypothetical protein DL763_010395 [Monosporascus cannonballus]